MNLSVVLLIVAVAIVGFATYFFSQSQDQSVREATVPVTQESQTMTAQEGEAMESRTDVMESSVMTEETRNGSYEPYAPDKLSNAEEGDVVLFFRAPWCPTCRALEADLEKNRMLIPEGLTILDVSYDTETALKQKYGVTYQHTLVQVDAQGDMIAKWSGSQSLAALRDQVQ